MAMAAGATSSIAACTSCFLSGAVSGSLLESGKHGASSAMVHFDGKRNSHKISKRMSPSPRCAFQLPELPYELDALEPHMSRTTLEVHWGKHHRAYVDNLNKQIEGTEEENDPLEAVILRAYNDGIPTPVFNNAGQIWNHSFFWESMKPRRGGGTPQGKILELINRDFGSYEEFKAQFKAAGASQFGSGWVWLVIKPSLEAWISQRRSEDEDEDEENDDGEDGHVAKDKDGHVATDTDGHVIVPLSIVKTPNAIAPFVWGDVPLLTMDVWEHAYYLDHQNRRASYIDGFLDNLVAWDVVEARLQVTLEQLSPPQQTIASP